MFTGLFLYQHSNKCYQHLWQVYWTKVLVCASECGQMGNMKWRLLLQSYWWKKIPEASPIFCVCYFFCDLKILLLGCDSDKFIFCLHKDSQNSGFKEIIWSSELSFICSLVARQLRQLKMPVMVVNCPTAKGRMEGRIRQMGSCLVWKLIKISYWETQTQKQHTQQNPAWNWLSWSILSCGQVASHLSWEPASCWELCSSSSQQIVWKGRWCLRSVKRHDPRSLGCAWLYILFKK